MKSRVTTPFRSPTSITTAISVALFSHFSAPSASAADDCRENDGATAGFGNAAGTWADPTTGNSSQDRSNGANSRHGDTVVNNGILVLGGTNNTTGIKSLHGVDTIGGLSVAWIKHPTSNGSYVAGHVVEAYATLTGTWTSELDPGPTISFPSANEVKFTFPTPLGTKKFARLGVTT
jgi:hypothetical protein